MHAVTRTSRIWILERYTSKLDRNEEGENERVPGEPCRWLGQPSGSLSCASASSAMTITSGSKTVYGRVRYGEDATSKCDNLKYPRLFNKHGSRVALLLPPLAVRASGA
jgi:hypothetical protein